MGEKIRYHTELEVYQAAFIYSLNHVEEEAVETQVWLSFSNECGYLAEKNSLDLIQIYDHILSICVKMIRNPNNWII